MDSVVMHIFTRTRRRGSAYKSYRLWSCVCIQDLMGFSPFLTMIIIIVIRVRQNVVVVTVGVSSRRRQSWHDNIIIDNIIMRDDGWNALGRKGLIGGDDTTQVTMKSPVVRARWWHNIRHDTMTPLQQHRINLRRGVLMRNADRVYYDDGGARSGKIPIHT